VSDCLDAAQAARRADQAAEVLVAAMAKAHPFDLRPLSEGLEAVSGRLDAAGAAKAAEALVAVMAKTTDPNYLIPLSAGLTAVSGRLDTDHLVTLLQHRLAAGRAQRVLLDVLGQRTRHTFRSPWHFLDWAASNGVDLVPPPRPARPAN
jgi:hypothetical protein